MATIPSISGWRGDYFPLDVHILILDADTSTSPVINDEGQPSLGIYAYIYSLVVLQHE